MANVDPATEQDVRELVLAFFADECEVEPSEITDETRIIEELEGDSLMLLALLDRASRRYGITVELKTLGRKLMQRPADTVGDIVTLTLALVEHGDRILDVDL